MAEVFDLSCPFRLSVPESELSHCSQNIHGDVPSLSRPYRKKHCFAKKHWPAVF